MYGIEKVVYLKKSLTLNLIIWK